VIFQRASELAIRAMVFLAQQPKDRLSPVREIAAHIGVSDAYLAKITQRLASAGLVRSVSGPGNGLGLRQAPGRIALATIVIALEGSIGSEVCVLGLEECSEIHPCALHSKWIPLRRKIIDLLEKTTLGDLVRSIQPGDEGVLSVDFVRHLSERG
jgi:Rrf2 family protein